MNVWLYAQFMYSLLYGFLALDKGKCIVCIVIDEYSYKYKNSS